MLDVADMIRRNWQPKIWTIGNRSGLNVCLVSMTAFCDQAFKINGRPSRKGI